MSLLTSGFAGRHVTVLSAAINGQERTDTGTVVEMDANWVYLARDNGEMLLFPTTAIRVIKLLEPDPTFVPNAGDLSEAPDLTTSATPMRATPGVDTPLLP